MKREKGLDPLLPDAPEHPGYISNVLHAHREVGDVIPVSHPAGDFFVNVTQQKDKKQPLVLISAGVGLTPLLSSLQKVGSRVAQRDQSRGLMLRGAPTSELLRVW